MLVKDAREGEKAEFRLIVTRGSDNVRGMSISSAADRSGTIELVSKRPVLAGETLAVSGRVESRNGFLQIISDSEQKLGEDEAAALAKEAVQGSLARVKVTDSAMLLPGEVPQKLKPLVQEAARRIVAAARLNRAILVRFHNDGDGICGGLALASMIKPSRFSALQNSSAIYRVPDALRDISALRSGFLPLIVLADFGVNEESIESLQLVKAAGIEVLVIDHHPPSDVAISLVDYVVTPMKLGGTSHYTAGWLCCETAKAAGGSAEKLNALAAISLTADKSRLHKPTEDEEQKALVFDYLGTYTAFPNTLDFYDSVLNDRGLFLSIYGQAKEKLRLIAESARSYTSIKDISGFKVAVIQLDKLVKKHEFPSKGKACGTVFDSLNKGEPLVAIGFGEKLINFRANTAAKERGFNATKLIASLKEEIKDGIESGGGHDVAASMRVSKGFNNIILEEILRKIGEIGKA
jgi:RecJ-like exonuclease